MKQVLTIVVKLQPTLEQIAKVEMFLHHWQQSAIMALDRIVRVLTSSITLTGSQSAGLPS